MQRFVNSVLVAVMALSFAACNSGIDEGDDDEVLVDAPAPPEGGFQVIGQKFTIAAGTEKFICQQVPVEITEDTWISSSHVYQLDGGHHVLMYYVVGDLPLEVEPHECNDLDMTGIRLVGTGSGNGGGVDLPEGKGLLIPTGSRLFFQSHYLNLTDADMLVQDVVNFGVIAEEDVTDKIGSFAHVDLTFAIPAGQEMTRTMRCEIPFDMHPTNLFPHMHEFGSYFRAHIERGEQVIPLFDLDWAVEFRDDFPDFENVGTLVFKKGDILETECTWQNTENEPLLFPQEMCVTFFMFYPSENGALLSCDETGFLDEV